MFRTIISIATATVVVAFTAPVIAQAASVSDFATARVSYADLNVETAVGARELAHRIDGAISRICGSAGSHDLAAFQQVQSCRKAALASTRSQVALVEQSARHLPQVASR